MRKKIIMIAISSIFWCFTNVWASNGIQGNCPNLVPGSIAQCNHQFFACCHLKGRKLKPWVYVKVPSMNSACPAGYVGNDGNPVASCSRDVNVVGTTQTLKKYCGC